jgi:hypothetical protein
MTEVFSRRLKNLTEESYEQGPAPLYLGNYRYLFGRRCSIWPLLIAIRLQSMSGDFRVALDFLDHPKTVRLKALVGAEGVFCLMRLWAFAGNYRPRGMLSGMNTQDVEIAAKWAGEKGSFVNALIESKFLDKLKNGVYRLHNWKLRQGYLYHKPERREQARKAGKTKRPKGDNGLPPTQNDNEKSPSPSPSPSPIPKESSPPSATDSLKKKKKTDPRIKLFIDYWYKDYGNVFPGEKYLVNGGKDAAAVKRLLGSANLGDAQDAASWFLRFKSDDWLGGVAKEITLFVMKYNDIRQRMRVPSELQPGDDGYVPN